MSGTPAGTIPDGAPAVPLSHSQLRLLLAEAASPGEPDHAVWAAYAWHGPVEAEALTAAADDVVKRHEILRTVYGWDARMRPVQRILPADGSVVLPTLTVQVHEAEPGDAEPDPVQVAHDALSRSWAEPFRLEAEPPVRLRLLRVAPDLAVLLVHVHHIALDGWSLGVLRADLSTAYQARLSGRRPDWPPAVPYREHVRREARGLEPGAERDLPFWRALLDDPPRPLLPDSAAPPLRDQAEDFAEPTAPAPAAVGGQDLVLESATVRAFLRAGRRLGALPSALLLDGVAETLGRHFAADRVRLGTMFSGRLDQDLRASLGCFVNPVVVPVDRVLSGVRADRVRVVGRTLFDCLAHAGTPYDRVVRAVAPGRRPESLYQVLTVLHSAAPSRWEPAPGVVARPLRVPAPVTASDLLVEATPVENGDWRLSARWRHHAIDAGLGRRLLADLAGRLTTPV